MNNQLTWASPTHANANVPTYYKIVTFFGPFVAMFCDCSEVGSGIKIGQADTLEGAQALCQVHFNQTSKD